MKLVQAEQKQIEGIVEISKAAFDSDIAVGASSVGGPPEYDSVAWHEQMFCLIMRQRMMKPVATP